MSKYSQEADFLRVPELDAAYRTLNAPECYRLLDGIPLNSRFLTLNIPLQLVSPTQSEVKIMEESLRLRRENGLVRVGNQEVIIPGTDYGVNPWRVMEVMEELKAQDDESAFSHTHWVTNQPSFHPLPSLGDLWHWSGLKIEYPEVDCRIIFNTRNEVRVMRYLG